jgi:hypothetical protein
MGSVSVYISTKDGSLLLHTDVVNPTEVRDENLVSGFLSAINSFASDMGWPAGVSLIRSGNLECRLSSGKRIFVALIIENPAIISTNAMLESYISSVASDICEKFENQYTKLLEKAQGSNNVYPEHEFAKFKDNIMEIVDKFGAEIKELYYKLILVDAIYSRVPMKWCTPLIEKAATSADLTQDFDDLIKKYPHFTKIIWKINNGYRPIWELFGVNLAQDENQTE